MDRIKRVSWFFRIFFQTVFVGYSLLFIYAWATCPNSVITAHGVINTSFIPRDYINHIFHPLTSTDKLLGGLISTVPVAIILYIIYSLISLFKLYERGEIFSLANVHYFRRIAYALLAGQLIDPFYQLAMGYILTRNNPPHQRFMSITLDQTNIEVILMALIVILISWIMAEGCKLREEQQLTV